MSAARKLRDLLPAATFLAVVVAAWQAWVEVRDTPPYLLPAPSRVAAAFWSNRDVLAPHVLTTVTEAGLGMVLGTAVGVVLAVALASIPLVRRVLHPVLVASQTVPMIVLAPLLALWFGFGTTPKVVVVALIAFFPVAVSTATALLQADRELVELVRSMGGGRHAVLRRVLVPSALPGLFAGLRISAAYAVAGAVVGEWVGASRGLGIFISRSQASFRVDQVFAAVVIVALLSAALFAFVGLLARLATPWQTTEPLSERSTS